MGRILVIKNADFSSVAVETIPSYIDEKVASEISDAVLKTGYSTGYTDGDYKIYSSSKRATVLVPVGSCIKSSPITYNDLSGQFDNLFIFKGAKKITLKMTNTDYYFGLTLYKNKTTQGYDSGWVLGGNTIVFEDEDFLMDDVWLACTLKNLTNTNFSTDETIQSLGWSCEVEY